MDQLGPPGPPDPVLVWSGYAQQAVVTGRPPGSSAVLLAIVHVGMYDTAVALGLHAQAYLHRERAPRGTSAPAAIATVAHHVLVARVPTQQAVLDAQYDQYLTGVRDGPARRAGVALGERVAARVLRWRDHDGLDAARMFAAVSMTMCDALITTWQAKLVYGMWRPITAIQLADTDGNPTTAADPAWTPLLTTPPYPDYVSGYNAVAASASKAMEEVFGPRLNLTLTSTAVPGTVRHYRSGRALRADVVDARILLGINFRFADTAARTLAVDLAEWALDHYFQPVHHHH